MTIQPVRIQRSRQHKQVSPNGLPIVYVGRPGKFGNPYFVVFESGVWIVKDKHTPFEAQTDSKDCAFNMAIGMYKEFIQIKVAAFGFDLSELKGKNLSCWCPIGSPCHADVLLKLANS